MCKWGTLSLKNLELHLLTPTLTGANSALTLRLVQFEIVVDSVEDVADTIQSNWSGLGWGSILIESFDLPWTKLAFIGFLSKSFSLACCRKRPSENSKQLIILTFLLTCPTFYRLEMSPGHWTFCRCQTSHGRSNRKQTHNKRPRRRSPKPTRTSFPN